MKPTRLLAALALTFACCVQAGAQTATAPAAATTTTVPSDQNYAPQLRYQAAFGDYLALRKGRQSDIVFIGDSITEQWRWGAGWPVWQRDFEAQAFDFGLSADRTQHVLWRLQHFDLSFLAPKVAVIMIGTNNVPDAPEDIAAGVRAVVTATQQKFPGVRVIVCSILPNARATEKMAAVNRLLPALADGKSVYYLDLAAKFTPEGDNWKGLSKDKLHLTTEGYEIWSAELHTMLRNVLNPK
jgi:lysophospholipase L1-like esterase